MFELLSNSHYPQCKIFQQWQLHGPYSIWLFALTKCGILSLHPSQILSDLEHGFCHKATEARHFRIKIKIEGWNAMIWIMMANVSLHLVNKGMHLYSVMVVSQLWTGNMIICLRKLYGQATRCKLVVIKTFINVSSKSCIQTTELLVRIRELGYTPIRFKRLKVLLLKIQTGRQLKNWV